MLDSYSCLTFQTCIGQGGHALASENRHRSI